MITVDKVAVFILVLTRISGVFLFSPLLSNRSVPNRLKIPLIIMISILIMPVASKTSIALTNHIQLLVYIFEEMTIGVIIGFVASFIFAAVQAAGEIFGMQIGYSIATILDPSTETDTGVLTTLYIAVGALIFLYMDGHHVIFSAAANSFQLLPISHGFSLQIGTSLSQLVERLLVISLQISAPVVVIISILNLIFGLITKISPQMNIYFTVGFIVGPLVGVGILMLSLPLFRFLMTKMTSDLGPDLIKTIHELKGI